MQSPSSGVLLIGNDALNDFSRLQLGGTTNAFPAIKRNGAAIDFRFADDSGFCDVSVRALNISVNGSSIVIAGANTLDRGDGTRYSFAAGSQIHRFYTNSGTERLTILNDGSVGIGTNTTNASAIVQIDSTTRGFLPPRMTTTQINAIASPAEGLVVFNTTISHLCVYQSGAWVRMSHSPM